MAERVLRSPGVTTREIDLSAPGRIRPQGIPAGIIGTAQKGPAFVPVTFANATEFYNIFGATGGVHFGAMAVNEWMRNARSGLFLRVLGIGDGKKAGTNGTNVTDNAGFYVGASMRDKDRNTSSAYDDYETDGSADGLVVNPYAGASVPDTVEPDTDNAVAFEGSVAADIEVWTIRVQGDNNNDDEADTVTPADYDGRYIVHEAAAGTKHVAWLSSQATVANGGQRDVSGTAVVDGQYTIKDFGATVDSVTLVDISGVTDATELALAIQTVMDNNSFSDAPLINISGDPNSGHVITGLNNTAYAGNQTQVANVTASAAYDSSDSPDSTKLLPIAQTPGIDGVGGAAGTLAVKFSATSLPAAGSTIVFTGQVATVKIGVEFVASGTTLVELTNVANDGGGVGSGTQESYIGIDLSSLTQSDGSEVAAAVDQALDDAYAALAADRQTDFNGSIGGASTIGNTVYTDPALAYTTIAWDTAHVAATHSAPTMTIVDNSPAASMGRTYFLGVEMYSTDGEQDYLNKDSGHTKTEKILRGVLMFPSGVIPGIVENGTNVADSDMPAAAYGSYGTGKDQGASDGKGGLAAGVFKMVLNGFTNTANYNAHLTGSFDPLSPIYFPKVLNTDPTKIQERGHYLYSHYDVPAGLAVHHDTSGDDKTYLLAGHDHNTSTWATENSNYKPTFEHWRQKFSHAASPWIVSQTLGTGPKKLFKFHMLDAGSGGHGQVKISITNIVKSTDLSSDYGRFDVQIRAASDLDTAPVVLQSFAGVNLNPASDRYIARVVGDQNTFYEFEKNEGKQKLVTEGLYPNNSQYVRVEVMPQVESGQMEATALPIGFQGKNHLVLNGQALGGTYGLKEPPLPFRSSLHVGTGSKKVVDARYYWGTQYQDIRTTSERNKETGIVSLVNNLTKHFPSVGEYPAWVGDNRNAAQGTGSADLDADAYNNNYFSLENIWVRCLAGNTSNAVDPTMWHEAVYIRNADTLGRTVNGIDNSALASDTNSAYWWQSAENGINETDNKNKSGANGYRYLDVAKDFGQAGSKKFFKFTVPVQGGFDGLDIFDQDKSEMNNLSAFREMSTNTSADLGGPDGPTTAAFRKALDILAEKSDVDVQLLATPGMRDAGITDYAIDKTEDRFDALYIMDMSAYDHDNYLVTTSSQETSVTNTAQRLLNRNLDTSFAATYFPDLVVQDGDNNVVVPPSVAVIGAMSLNDSVAHPWYAPAGFARGALASTLETAVKLNRPNMDVLYDSDINPITSFPETGDSVVVFGQKTMLQAQSALDRVNVRRLLIDVRRKVRTVANQILFEPNREATLARFSSLVNPILGRIQAQQGIDRYKVIIDTTTTTQQDVENNTIRGKIFLQPTRSIEFISLDFVVTNAGAEI